MIPRWAVTTAAVVAGTIAVLGWSEARFVLDSEYAAHLRDYARAEKKIEEHDKLAVEVAQLVAVLRATGKVPGPGAAGGPPPPQPARKEPPPEPVPDVDELIRDVRELRRQYERRTQTEEAKR